MIGDIFRIVFIEKGRMVCDDSPQALRNGNHPRINAFLKRCEFCARRDAIRTQ